MAYVVPSLAFPNKRLPAVETDAPFGVFAGALVFAFVDALQMHLQAAKSPIPFPILMMLPYLVTIIALVGLGPLLKKVESPRKLAIPYEKGQV